MDNRRLSELVVFRAAGLAPEEGASVILPGRMPGDSSRYANGMPDGWGVGDERPSDEYIACHVAQDALRHGNHGADGRIDSDLFARLRDGEGLQEWLDAGGDPNVRVTCLPMDQHEPARDRRVRSRWLPGVCQLDRAAPGPPGVSRFSRARPCARSRRAPGSRLRPAQGTFLRGRVVLANEPGRARRLRRLPVVSRAACAPLDQA